VDSLEVDEFQVRARVPKIYKVFHGVSVFGKPVWKAVRNPRESGRPWPSVNYFDTHAAAMEFVHGKVAEWCRDELVRNGYSLLALGNLTASGEWLHSGWMWHKRKEVTYNSRYTIETRSDVVARGKRYFTTENEAWLDAWHHYRRTRGW
jgi:hypothetical protein